MEELFLTGATGFIGSKILQNFLDNYDLNINLLARGKRDEAPEDRINKLLTGLYPGIDISRFLGRVKVFTGDISLNNMGIGDAEYEGLKERVTRIIHCAAAARFDLKLEEARRSNLLGTENILSFAKKCNKLKKLEYIGTAYVAGRRKGVIKESELDKGQEHNNTYERTKLEAEKLVRENISKLPLTIFRPSIVIGDSVTGQISSFSAFYRVLKMYKLGHLKVLPGYPGSVMDLVPLNYVTEAMDYISKSTGSLGECYHLTSGLNNFTTLEEISSLASHYFGKGKFVLIPPEEFNSYISKAGSKFSEEEKDMIDEIKLYMPYLTSESKFDNSNTLSILENTGIKVPRLGDYFSKMAENIGG